MRLFKERVGMKQIKKITLLIIAALILLLSASAFADGPWACECGQTGNTGNFCPNCSRRRPSSNPWFCPRCDHMNQADYNYCENCAEPKPQDEQWALATMKLAINAGPGTARYFTEIGTYNVKGQMVRVYAKSWDTDNDIWWIKCEIPETNHVIGWTGLKRFDQSTFDLDALPVVNYDRKTRRFIN